MSCGTSPTIRSSMAHSGCSIVIPRELQRYSGFRTVDCAKNVFQKCRCHDESRTLIPTHVYSYRVTSQTKAMEDAVEIGLRSAFNEVEFTSFSKVLPGFKLRGEHSRISYGLSWSSYMRRSQPGNRLCRTTSPTNSTNSSKRPSRGIAHTIARK